MNIKNNTTNTSPAFQARFFYSDALKSVVDYAITTNHFEKLNKARKNISASHFNIRLLLDIGESTTGKPCVNITRFVQKENISFPQNSNDYNIVKQITFKSSKKMNPLKFALQTIIKLGNNAPKNKMFQATIIDK